MNFTNTKKRTVKIKGSVGFALLTVRLKNGTVTVALAVKKRYGKKNGKRYGTDTLPYGTDTVAVTNSDPLWLFWAVNFKKVIS